MEICSQLKSAYKSLKSLEEDFGMAIHQAEAVSKDFTATKISQEKLVSQIRKTKEYIFKTKEGVAERILGKDYISPAFVAETFGVTFKHEDIPPIPFKIWEIERAKKLGMFLILRMDKAPDGQPLTMRKLNEMFREKIRSDKKGTDLFGNPGWHNKDRYFNKDTSRARWALVSKEVIPNSTEKNYLQQTAVLAEYIKNNFFKNQDLPLECQSAIAELEAEQEPIGTLLSHGENQISVKRLSQLKINQFRRQPVEFFYDWLLYFLKNKKMLADRHEDWLSRGHNVGFVYMGQWGILNARADDCLPILTPKFGTCLSYSAGESFANSQLENRK